MCCRCATDVLQIYRPSKCLSMPLNVSQCFSMSLNASQCHSVHLSSRPEHVDRPATSRVWQAQRTRRVSAMAAPFSPSGLLGMLRLGHGVGAKCIRSYREDDCRGQGDDFPCRSRLRPPDEHAGVSVQPPPPSVRARQQRGRKRPKGYLTAEKDGRHGCTRRLCRNDGAINAHRR